MSSCCGGGSPTQPLTQNHRLKIRYLGGRPIRVTGPVSRQSYEFSGKQREQLVDPRDAAEMLRTRGFQLVSITELSEEPDHG